jgi:hypothetical protein
MQPGYDLSAGDSDSEFDGPDSKIQGGHDKWEETFKDEWSSGSDMEIDEEDSEDDGSSAGVYNPALERNYKPVDNSFDYGDHFHTISEINNELLEPGLFLTKAIRHMINFGKYNDPAYLPRSWLDRNRDESKRRYVLPEILEERKPRYMKPLEDGPACTWTEHARAKLMNAHEEHIAHNIEEFLEIGIDNDHIRLAAKLQAKHKAECDHLPLIWSVVNVRTPFWAPESVIAYMNESDHEWLHSEIMLTLIQSRYMINIAKYDIHDDKIEALTSNAIFQIKIALVFPLIVVDNDEGDIFFFLKDDDKILTYYLYTETNKEAQAKIVLEAIRKTCPWWGNTYGSETMVHETISLVSAESPVFSKCPKYIKVPLALEMLCHALTESESTTYAEGQLSSKLNELIQECEGHANFEAAYEARMWWSITRGELGVHTKAMENFNARRGLFISKRSAWDYKKRHALSEKFTRDKWVSPLEVNNVLEDFNDFDAITFSNNTIVTKYTVINALVNPQDAYGQHLAITNSYIDTLNRHYSNNGGPRMYSQRELDYMMTNIGASAQREKLTSRLFHKKSVYFMLSHEVSLTSINQYGISSHSALCKVTYNQSAHAPRRELVVYWLEGVFEDVYKLCAVPILTYLSLYFDARVRQVQYVKEQTVCTNGPHCATLAIFAASRRMHHDVYSPDQPQSEGVELPVDHVLDFRSRLILSLIIPMLPEKEV